MRSFDLMDPFPGLEAGGLPPGLLNTVHADGPATIEGVAVDPERREDKRKTVALIRNIYDEHAGLVADDSPESTADRIAATASMWLT